MTAVRRRCPCAVVIESEPDPGSIGHAEAVHRNQPEHRRFEYTLRAELAPTYEQVRAELVPRLARVG